ncbi:MAG: hypothetical protein HC830_08225, partial [Bacteroidetes bacterium]|nr:hypothetical protein [Bacteroidota bacterium]
EKLFFRVVKATFNQRRKVISNSVKAVANTAGVEHPLFGKRPEQLSVAEFVELTKFVSTLIN